MGVTYEMLVRTRGLEQQWVFQPMLLNNDEARVHAGAGWLDNKTLHDEVGVPADVDEGTVGVGPPAEARGRCDETARLVDGVQLHTQRCAARVVAVACCHGHDLAPRAAGKALYSNLWSLRVPPAVVLACLRGLLPMRW